MFNLVSAPRPASPVCTLVSPTWTRTPSVRGILKPLRRTSSSTSLAKASGTTTVKTASTKKVQFNEEPSVRLYDPEDRPDGRPEPVPVSVPEPPKPALARRRTGIVRRPEWTSALCCAYDGSRANGAWSDDEDGDEDDEDDGPVRPAFARRGTGPPPPKVDWTAQVRPSADASLVELPGKYPVMVPRKVFEEAAARSVSLGGLSPPSLKIDSGVGASPSKFGVVAPKAARPDALARTQTSGSPSTASTALMRSPSRKAEEDAIDDVVPSAVFLRHHLQGPIELRLEYAIRDLDIDEMDAECCAELAKAVELELEGQSAAPPPRSDQVEDHIEFLTKLHEYLMDSCEA